MSQLVVMENCSGDRGREKRGRERFNQESDDALTWPNILLVKNQKS